MTGWTGFPELDALLASLRDSARTALGDTYIGTYLQGSFALGAGSEQSDADFIVVAAKPPSGDTERALRRLHADIPDRPGIWSINLEGSYADAASLGDGSALDVPWLYVNRGHREMSWDLHCNTLHTRWILRNHGITVDGPSPATLVDAVPEEALRASARRSLPRTLDEIASWAEMDNAWTQRYLVETCCRVLYTASTGRVLSKPAALAWAEETLDAEWHPLLAQVAADRLLPWQPVDPARPGSTERAIAFADHVTHVAAELT